MVDGEPRADRADDALGRVRAACSALPEVTERPSHGAPTFFVRNRSSFVTFQNDHHGDGRLSIWCAAPDGVQAELIDTDPDRFFRPPYVGHRGWLGVLLDDIDVHELTAICREAYQSVAPRGLLTQLEGDRAQPG